METIQPIDINQIECELQNFPEGLAFPWENVNKISRIDAGGLTVIAAGTSHGKSTLGYNLILHILDNYDGAVILWTGEMANVLVYARLVGILAGRSFTNVLSSFRRGLFTPEDVAAKEKIAGWADRLYIIDSLKQNVVSVSQLANALKAITEHQKIAAVFVDYLQQMVPPAGKRYGSREQEVTAVAKHLHCTAVGMQIPIIAFAQINRTNLQYKEKPRLTDLRESGGVEQYAQAVFGLWNSNMAGKRDTKAPPLVPTESWYWSENKTETESAVAVAEKRGGVLLEISVLKNRLRGNVAKAVPLLFFPNIGRLESFPALETGEISEDIDDDLPF